VPPHNARLGLANCHLFRREPFSYAPKDAGNTAVCSKVLTKVSFSPAEDDPLQVKSDSK
jgi:hypothetical protein